VSTGWALLLFIVGFAVVFWLFMWPLSQWSVTGTFRDPARPRRRRRSPVVPPVPQSDPLAVTRCACDQCRRNPGEPQGDAA
jgi:hypothetical protein